MRELDTIPSPVRLWACKLVARFGFSRIIHAVLDAERRYVLDDEPRSLDAEYIGRAILLLYAEQKTDL